MRHEDDAEEYYRKDREARELRLERKSLKYLDAQHKRDRKNKEGRSHTADESMKDYRAKLAAIQAKEPRSYSEEERAELQRQADALTSRPMGQDMADREEATKRLIEAHSERMKGPLLLGQWPDLLPKQRHWQLPIISIPCQLFLYEPLCMSLRPASAGLVIHGATIWY